MMVIFLTGLVSMILLRTLRNDYAKCVLTSCALLNPVSHDHNVVRHIAPSSAVLGTSRV